MVNSKAGWLMVAMLLIMAVSTLNAQSTMRLFHTGTFAAPAYWKSMGVEGDTLALYNYQFVGRNFQLLRQAVSPDLGPLPIQTIMDYNIDTYWGTIDTEHIYFRYWDGILYSALKTNTKLLVFVTTHSVTTTHVLDITGLNISLIEQYYSAQNFVIKDANLGYCMTYGHYPDIPCRYYVIDLTTDTLRMFHESMDYAHYFLLNQGYILLSGYWIGQGSSWLVDGENLIQELNTGYFWTVPGIIMQSTLIGDRYNSLLVSNGVDRAQDYNYLGMIEDDQYQILGECSNAGSPFVACGDSSFCYINTVTSLEGGSVEWRGFKNLYVSEGQLYPDNGFPNLESYTDPITLLAMGSDYIVAVSGIVGQALGFSMVDIPQQRIATDYYMINDGGYSTYISSENQLYLIHSNGIDIFYRGLGLGVQDDVIPEPILHIEAAPNPFMDACKIGVTTAKDSRIKVSVYNLRGQLTKTLYDGVNPRGKNSFQWDGRNEQNKRAAAGVYWIKVDAGTATATRKIVLMH